MSKNFVCDDSTIVKTNAGKLQGFMQNSTYIFQGIKYADAKRFQAPQPVKPWRGVKQATSYGFVAPLMSQETPNGEIMVPHRYWPMDENCQYLNIWTQSLDPAEKRPVMVWLHGGGFTSGSSIEQVAYDGESLSVNGNVVVVSLNHRLNILGYLDLSYYNDKYANSGNAGNADIVAALVWIHENIARFGGDPDNVTLFGQSGGGMKVWQLMQTPSADGLFHKAIIQSGLVDGFLEEESSPEISEALMAELKIDKKDVEKLETVPYQQLADAHNKIYPAFFAQQKYAGLNPSVNDFYLGDPRKVGFTAHAKTIPVLIGTTFAEMSFETDVRDKYSISEEKVRPMIEKRYGADISDQMISAFKQAYPGKALSDLLYVDALFRTPTIDFIKKKSEFAEAPTYAYLFAFDFPLEGGKAAWHCAEIPFVFHNTARVPVCNVSGVSDRLEKQMSWAWVEFAESGKPSSGGLPEWPACKPGDEATMIFDRICRLEHNFDHELIDLAWQRPPKVPFLHLENADNTPEQEDKGGEQIFLH